MLRTIRFAIAIAAALTLSACAGGTPKTVTDLFRIGTATIVSPVDSGNIFQIKAAYNVALNAANQWRDTCWSKPYAELMKSAITRTLCSNRRQVLRAIQQNEPKAFAAITAASTFVTNNPTLNASTLISAAWTAFQTYQASIPKA